MSNLAYVPAITGNKKAVRQVRLFAGLVVVVPFFGVILGGYLAYITGVTWKEVCLFCVSYIFGMLGITLGYHRYFAHRSFKTSHLMQIFFVILGSCSAQGPLFFWVATHRRHHIHSDQPGDPHSPNLCGTETMWQRFKGFCYGHIGWMFSKEITNWSHFVPDLLRDKSLFKWQSWYFTWLLLGLALPALIGFFVIGGALGALKGFLWGGLMRIFFVNHSLWLVGSLSHMIGSAPFRHQTQDKSVNNWWVALLAFGEGNQNNHHAFPNSAKHGLEWWQPDLTYHVIRFLEKCHLLWDVKEPSRKQINNQMANGR